MDLYQQIIAKSRYSRYLESEQRREHFSETVSRYLDFFDDHIKKNYGVNIPKEEIRPYMEGLQVMPSMRALMTSGPALDRDNTAGYNCAYLPVDDPVAFDEALHILSCGTGVGFSAEKKYVSKLPELPTALVDDTLVYRVEDSKEGWALGLRHVVQSLYKGIRPKYDLSLIRPAGARLKTFGGRASGPDPLDRLFKFVTQKFEEAIKIGKRKLTPLDCHDIMCMVADVIVVGGVRRSALISLSDLDDEEIRGAKSGEWYKKNKQRALANNSAVYNERPTREQFDAEWKSLYESYSGERGIFNREASQNIVKSLGKRDYRHDFGTNPCCFTGEMRLLTLGGYVPFEELSGNVVRIVNHDGNVTEGKVWEVGIRPIVIISFKNVDIKIKCTPDHIFMLEDGSECAAKDLAGKSLKTHFGKHYERVVSSVEPHGEATVYDFTEPETHWGVVEGVVVHNSEIILRANQFCNLTSIAVRPEDTEEDLAKKARIAAILGTYQSTLTNFPYLRDVWRKNTEEERLLGVSLSGLCDHPILNGTSEEAKKMLQNLKQVVIDTNKEVAEWLGINPSTATTCVKPEGTTSQLNDTASGMHTRYAPYYIRRIRNDIKDPLSQFLIDIGVPYELEIKDIPSSYVFDFPRKSPEGSLTRDDLTALEQLEYWKHLQENWCEHKPSATIYIKEHEWDEVAEWVWDNFDILSGVSFLPYDGGIYKQAPYEPISKEKYEQLCAEMPQGIDWDLLIEFDDNVEGVQNLACVAGICEI